MRTPPHSPLKATTARRSAVVQEAEFVEDRNLIDPSGNSGPLTGEMWDLTIYCKSAIGGRDRIVQATLDKAKITFFALISFKEQLGYGLRDYLYYKKRCGPDVATLQLIEFTRDVEDMLQNLASEREVRMVLTTEEPHGQHVNITPLKRPRREVHSDDDDDDDEAPGSSESTIDAYKDWLLDLEENNEDSDFKDDYREDTIKTYTEWLRDERDLKDIMAYKDYVDNDDPTTIHAERNVSSQTPPPWPSHARKKKNQAKGEKKVGRGTLKGLTAMAKRMKARSHKLKIQFSATLNGPVGENERTFVDEVVLFTRLKAPLIGVKYWKDVKENVKNSIANTIMSLWDFENIDNPKEKILKIANKPYRGWRSTFSATYKAYDSYDARMKHKLEDLDIVEWHYLIMYFGSEKFKKVSNQNSSNRQQMKTMHVMGSKPFSQCSWEQRDPEIGVEPGLLSLWKTTHTKQGKWSNEMSKDIYINAARKLSTTESDETIEGETESITPSSGDEDLVFQSTYKETTGSKSTKRRGVGYMSKYPIDEEGGEGEEDPDYEEGDFDEDEEEIEDEYDENGDEE